MADSKSETPATAIETHRETESWADEALEEAQEEANADSSSISELNVEVLKIDDKQINMFLDEPDDSSIQAVCD